MDKEELLRTINYDVEQTSSCRLSNLKAAFYVLPRKG